MSRRFDKLSLLRFNSLQFYISRVQVKSDELETTIIYFWHFLSLSQISRQKSTLMVLSLLLTILICLLQSRSNIKKSLVSYKPSSLDIILAEMKTISGITKQKRDTFHFLYSSLQSLFLSIPRWCFVGKRDSVLPL